jgi:ATP-dependent RNA helicase RhlE
MKSSPSKTARTVKSRIPSRKPAHKSAAAPAIDAFDELIPELRQAVANSGYLTPTPIQEQCIPHLLEGRDLVGTAQTGTGKTAAFALPVLQRLSAINRRPRGGSPRALVLAPTRELAGQIGESFRTYGAHLRLTHTTIFGGVNQFHQVKALNRGIDILVATPGRLLDLMQQGHVRLNNVEVFILDEVDRMLDMGFLPDIKRVLTTIPDERQTLFFSATMAPKMAKLAYTMVNNPVRVTIAPEQLTVERINQKVLFVDKKDKDALLVDLFNDTKIFKAIVFTQMKHVASRVAGKLQKAGISGTAIHGNKSQGARTRALKGFKQDRYRVLVATDVAARGLDVDDITHVINYDLPVEAETYVHRIGRTARAGADGDAISFCSAEDRANLREIERLLGESVEADMDHDYHCDDALRSTIPKTTGRGGGSRGRSSGGYGRTGRSEQSFDIGRYNESHRSNGPSRPYGDARPNGPSRSSDASRPSRPSRSNGSSRPGGPDRTSSSSADNRSRRTSRTNGGSSGGSGRGQGNFSRLRSRSRSRSAGSRQPSR